MGLNYLDLKCEIIRREGTIRFVGGLLKRFHTRGKKSGTEEKKKELIDRLATAKKELAHYRGLLNLYNILK